MDMYRKHSYNYNYNPSFSSTLLDQIYRSIDETNDHHVADVDNELVFYDEAKDEAGFQRIENWMEKRNGSERILKAHDKSANTDQTYQRKNGEKFESFMNFNSSWSSSDSSSGGLFSEAESNYGVSSRSSSTTSFRPKPIRTCTDVKKMIRDEERDYESGSGVVKRSKLKALKIYGDLKKAKPPISPGAKLASFLNSLFTTGGNAKKGKISSDSLNTSPACSTSRSCLSKSPGKLSTNGTKRSVRFYPVSVIVDEDCQPCGHKSLQHGHGVKNIRRKDQSVREAAREMLKNYQQKVERQMEDEDEDEEDDDDDDASYASSDLFELDNLNNDNDGIDIIGNYMEELPVYETTYLDANQAYC